MYRRLYIKVFTALWLVTLAILGVYSIDFGEWTRARFPFAKTAIDSRDTIDVAPYIYGETPLISLGEIRNAKSAYFHMSFRFRAENTNGNPNVFQTAPVNRGIRMEISGSNVAIIVPDLSVPGGLKGLTLSTSLKEKQWYLLEVEALNGTFVHIKLDGKDVADYASTGISFETSKFFIGGGFDDSRIFLGQIEDISITKGNLTHPLPEKIPSDSLALNFTPYVYEKTPAISLGEIQNPDNAYIHLKLRFRAENIEGNTDIFQTAPVNQGMRVHISGSTAAIIIPDASAKNGLQTLLLSTKLKPKQWHSLEIGALNGAFIHATLDGRLVTDYTNAHLSMKTTNLLVGGEYASNQLFRGQIDNISIIKGNRPSLLFKNIVIQFAFYLLLAIGLLYFLVSYFLSPIQLPLKLSLPSPRYLYSNIFISILGMSFLYYAYQIVINGYLPAPFVYDKSNTFMDFFNAMFWASDNDRYTEWHSVYPPLSFLLLQAFNFLLGSEWHANAITMRGNVAFIALLVLLYLVTPAIVLRTRLWQSWSINEKIFAYFAIILSAPMLFALERGNLILLCPIFLAFVFSRIGIIRSVCIALLINIKPYFVLLIFYYIFRKNWRGLSACLTISGCIFVVTGLILDSHFLNFFINILGFSNSKGMFSFKDVMALPSSISAFSYVLRNPEGAGIESNLLTNGLNTSFLSSQFSLLVCYVVEGAKWILISSSLLVLFAKSKFLRDVEVFTLLIVIITNLGVWVGGYSLIFYSVLIPVFFGLQRKWAYIGIISMIAMPLDLIPITASYITQQYSFLSNSNVDAQWYLGLGSVVRPIANLILLFILSSEFLTRASDKPTVYFP